MKVERNVERWLNLAVGDIRFKPDREAVRQELQEQLEDKILDLMRIFPDMTRLEAETMALSQMGDAVEIGRELAKIHKPWWGYIWKVTHVIAVALALWMVLMWVAVPLWQFMPWRVDLESWYQTEFGQSEWEYVDECYLTGKDPFDESSPWYDPAQPQTGVIRTPLLTSKGGESARTERYRFEMGRYALWSFSDTEDPEEDWWLFSQLKVTGLPWEPFSYDSATHISATDSLGNYYYNSYETYDLNMARGEDEGYVMVNGGGSSFLTQTFDVQIMPMATDIEWIRLDFERGGESWSLTIPFEEVGQ